jgi:hypothetical protein
MANPTTNYGWPMPTATDLVTDLPADFAAFGQPVDTSLKALNPETTLGDISYRSATANTNTRLAIGSNGNVLTVSGGVPTWAAPAGGGKVLQVVQGTTSTSTTIATTTYTDTTLTATITPSSATSKVLVLVMQNWCNFANTSAAYSAIKLLRGATDVYVSPTNFGMGGTYGNTSTIVESRGMAVVNYLDSPATTSATTYKTQGRPENSTSSQNVIFQQGSNPSTIILLEIGA